MSSTSSSVAMSPSVMLLGVVEYLRQKVGIHDVSLQENSPAARHDLFLWEQKCFCLLPEDVKAFYLASNGFKLTWNVNIEGSVLPLGRMHINSIENVVRVGEPCVPTSTTSCLLDVESDSEDDNGEQTQHSSGKRRHPSFNIKKCNLFELDSCSGNGKVCLVFFNHPDCKAPEIWFMDRALRWHYLAESFSAYYRMMVMNLGLPQWQYLFTDIGLSPENKKWLYLFSPSHREQISITPETLCNRELNKLDAERLFSVTRSTKKKAVASSATSSQTSSTSGYTRKKIANTSLTHRNLQKPDGNVNQASNQTQR